MFFLFWGVGNGVGGGGGGAGAGTGLGLLGICFCAMRVMVLQMLPSLKGWLQLLGPAHHRSGLVAAP